jgi:hypothetical protein
MVAFLVLEVLGFHILSSKRIRIEAPPVCYPCFWNGYDPKLRSDLIKYYSAHQNSDPLVEADSSYILWRASGVPDCGLRETYARVASSDDDVFRRLMARAILGFGAPECAQDGSKDLKKASDLAEKAGLPAEAKALHSLGAGDFQPRFEEPTIATSLVVPADAATMILGDSTIDLSPGLRVGTQVDRVARDWISYQMRWDLSGKPLPDSALVNYHEGALVLRMRSLVPIEVYPLAGALIAQRGEHWYGMDETGAFRFEILRDKTEYPTTHAFSTFGWIEDTHGISALVSQALERKMQVVVGCGDAEGKAQAAYYLARRGVHVVLPGDRSQDLLLGYQAEGTIVGTAPVKNLDGRVAVGHQPIRFSLHEPFVVEDTKQPFPVQYYDAGARYFRRLSEFAPLRLEYVEVTDANQIGRVLDRADQIGSSAVAVRVTSEYENEALFNWLKGSRNRRAILFHSGLYPFAQPLFENFPEQVTFGDLHPKFE